MVNQIKTEKINVLHEKFSKAKSAVLADYLGMTVAQMTDLRSQLREANVEFKVLKNTLAKIAVDETPFSSIKDQFAGPISIALSYDDVVAPAKVMTSYAKKEKNLTLKGGIIEGKIVKDTDLITIAGLPSKEVLLGKVLGTLNAPITNFVGIMGGISRQFLYLLNAIKEQKGGK